MATKPRRRWHADLLGGVMTLLIEAAVVASLAAVGVAVAAAVLAVMG